MLKIIEDINIVGVKLNLREKEIEKTGVEMLRGLEIMSFLVY